MLCKHLAELDNELKSKSVKETFRGKAWSKNCREWVYYDCFLNLDAIRKRLKLDECVVDHQHLGTHDGHENGFVCKIHDDGVMGVHERYANGKTQIE